MSSTQEATGSEGSWREQPKEPRTKARIAIAVLWLLSMTLAFVLGLQMGSGKRLTTEATPSPAAATTPDPEMARILRSLPRRQADDPLAIGSPTARVVLTEWSDYRCPYCAKWANGTFPELRRYIDDGSLRIEYRDMATFGDESIAIAVAARAAGRQGRFWPYYHTVYAAAGEGDHPSYTKEDLIAFARTAGVPDLAQFETELTDPRLRAAVLADTTEAQRFGITGTPFFVINDTVISGAQPTENFIATIEKSLKE